MNTLFSSTRLAALLIKELIQMQRDRVTFAMMRGVPLMQLILFGFAINNDPKDLPAALVTTSQDAYTRAMVSAMGLTGYYRFDHVVESAAEADALLERGIVSFVVTTPSDFVRRVERGLEHEAARLSDASLEVIVHRRYNPEGITQYNIVPGLLGVILQMTMVMMTAMALTREGERGTLENLLAMPASPLEIMLGKVLPYLLVGAVQVTVVLVAARLLFSIPFVGSLPLILTSVLIFVFSLVLLGYTISTLARTQLQAMQLTFFFFLPSLLLSGFMFPFRGMPGWAQAFGEIFPLTHFLRVIRAVMLKGADLPAVQGEIVALLVFVLVFAGIALMRFRRTLD